MAVDRFSPCRGGRSRLPAGTFPALGGGRAGVARGFHGGGRMAGRRARHGPRPLRRARRRVPAPPAAPQARDGAHLQSFPRRAAVDVADREGRARSRHRVVGRRALRRPAGLGEAARVSVADAHRRGARLPRQRDERAVPPHRRLGRDAAPGPVARRVAVHQGARLSRHDHPEGIRRERLLGVRAFASHRSCRRARRRRRSR